MHRQMRSVCRRLHVFRGVVFRGNRAATGCAFTTQSGLLDSFQVDGYATTTTTTWSYHRHTALVPPERHKRGNTVTHTSCTRSHLSFIDNTCSGARLSIVSLQSFGSTKVIDFGE